MIESMISSHTLRNNDIVTLMYLCHIHIMWENMETCANLRESMHFHYSIYLTLVGISCVHVRYVQTFLQPPTSCNS